MVVNTYMDPQAYLKHQCTSKEIGFLCSSFHDLFEIRRTLEGSLHILRSDNFDVIDGPAGACKRIRWSIKPRTS